MKNTNDPLAARYVLDGKPADAETLKLLADLRAFNASFEDTRPAAPTFVPVYGGDREDAF